MRTLSGKSPLASVQFVTLEPLRICDGDRLDLRRYQIPCGGVAELVGIEGGVVSGVINLESSGVEAPDWRPRHDGHYHEALIGPS